ncbi:hypothetical protein COBT_002573 [Conglomerata obtusa]
MSFEKILKDAECIKNYLSEEEYESLVALIIKARNNAENEEEKKQEDAERKVHNIRAEEFKAEGNDFFKNKNYDEAVLAYTQAIDEDDQNPIYYSNRAAAYAKLDMVDNGIEDCLAAVKLDPCFVKAYIRLGDFYRDTNVSKAREYYKKALELEPSNDIITKKISHLNENGNKEIINNENNNHIADMLKNPDIMNMAKDLMKGKSSDELKEMMENMFKNMQKK